MAFGDHIIGTAKVVYEAVTAEFNQAAEKAEQTFERSTQGISSSASRLEASTKRMAASINPFRKELDEVPRSTTRATGAVEGMARSWKMSESRIVLSTATMGDSLRSLPGIAGRVSGEVADGLATIGLAADSAGLKVGRLGGTLLALAGRAGIIATLAGLEYGPVKNTLREAGVDPGPGISKGAGVFGQKPGTVVFDDSGNKYIVDEKGIPQPDVAYNTALRKRLQRINRGRNPFDPSKPLFGIEAMLDTPQLPPKGHVTSLSNALRRRLLLDMTTATEADDLRDLRRADVELRRLAKQKNLTVDELETIVRQLTTVDDRIDAILARRDHEREATLLARKRKAEEARRRREQLEKQIQRSIRPGIGGGAGSGTLTGSGSRVGDDADRAFDWQRFVLERQATFFASFGSNVFTEQMRGGRVHRDMGTDQVVVNQYFQAPPSTDRAREARLTRLAFRAIFD